LRSASDNEFPFPRFTRACARMELLWRPQPATLRTKKTFVYRAYRSRPESTFGLLVGRKAGQKGQTETVAAGRRSQCWNSLALAGCWILTYRREARDALPINPLLRRHCPLRFRVALVTVMRCDCLSRRAGKCNFQLVPGVLRSGE